MKQKTNSLFNIASKIRTAMQLLFLAMLMLAITAGTSHRALAQNCVNTIMNPASSFAAPSIGAGPYTIADDTPLLYLQQQRDYNQMTGALPGHTFRSVASKPGTWITVRRDIFNGTIVAQGSTPLNWTAVLGGTYFIHYNVNSSCGTSTDLMVTTIENTSVCNTGSRFPDEVLPAPIRGAGPYTITADQIQQEYNQMSGAIAGHTFRSTAGIAGTWITVRAGSVAGALVAHGSTPLNWTAAAGGTYFILYNANSACNAGFVAMTTTVENTTPCTNSAQFPAAAFTAPIKGNGPYTITTGQFQSQYNQMTGAVAGSSFQSTAGIAGTYITVRAGSATGAWVAQGTTPLNWTAAAGGTYFIHYNTNALCGTANVAMTTTVVNTTPVCANSTQYPTTAFSAPVKGAGPYSIGSQFQSTYNQMTNALTGSTFRSIASIAGTWITVRAGSANGALVAQGSTPLNWTAAAGGTYTIHYNTNSACGTPQVPMNVTVENTTPVCLNGALFPGLPFSAPIRGAGPYTITNGQWQQEYNQMTGAIAGHTFRSTAGIAGTWITVRAGSASSTPVAQGSTPLNWTAAAGGTYFIDYNTNSTCGTAEVPMTTTVENTTPCANSAQFPAAAFTAPIRGNGPYTITTSQFQSQYNQMTGALVGSSFQSTAGIAGTYITVRAGSATGALVVQGSTPLNWTAAAGGTYFIHYNTNATCGTANVAMTTTIENTTPCAANSTQFPLAAITAPIRGYGPRTIANNQFQSEYNQITGAVAGHTFRSTAGIAGTWITVRAGSANGALVAQGSTPLNWTASAGETYFIHYNTNATCGTAAVGMITTVENTSPPDNDAFAQASNIAALPYTSPVIFNTWATDDITLSTCNDGGPYKNLWWKVTANCETLTASTCGASFDTKLAVFTGSSGAFTQVACNDDFGPSCATNQASVSWAATPGTVYYISAGSFFSSSPTGSMQLSVSTPTAIPAIPTLISGVASVCAGSQQTYSIAAVTNASNYTWTAPANASIVSGQGSLSVVVQYTSAFVSGNLSVVSSNCSGTSAAQTLAVTKIATSATPGTITGLASVCAGSQQTYSIAAVTNASNYTWTAPANASIVSGQGGLSVVVQYTSAFVSGNVSVVSSNCSGTSAAQTLAVTKIATSATPGTITGVASVCAGSQQTYSIAAVTNATNYTWSAPANASIVSGQGGLSVVVQYTSAFVSGNVSVVSSNCSGTSAAQTLAVTKIATSATPGTITGVASVCAGSQQTYSIAAVTNASNYTWSAPANASIVSGQGGLSVVVQFTSAFISGNVSVVSSNCSGTSAAKTLAVTKIATSATPGTITGVASVCAGAQQTYSIAAVTNATNYTWSAPANASIVSGQGGLSVVVQFTSAFVSGNVSVVSSNCTGTSAARTLAVTKAAVPGTVGTISGVTAGACSAETRTYTVASLTNTTSYDWIAPANASILSGQGTTSVVVQFAAGFTTGTLSVKGVNCSGTSVTARTLALSNVTATPTVLTGPATAVCAGSTQTYSTTAVTGATSYLWTVPTGAVINGANNGISISVTFPSPFTTGAVTVKSATACYTSAAKSLTVYSTPATPTSITGPLTAVCSGSTQTYSCTASTTGATGYNWTVPTGATILTVATTNSITVQFPTPFVSGAVTVKAFNTCGESVAKSATVSSTIAQPGVIAGTSTNLCGGGSYTYTIAAVTGATGYNWSAPTGWTITANTGTSVTVSIPTTTFTTATLSVIAQSACGNSTARTLTLSALPATPTAITGSTSVCASATGLVYSTPVVAGVTSYTWTVPTGAIITSGQNTSSITVTWGTVAGSVTVKAGNTCGINATAKTLAVTLAVCRLGEELAEEPSIEEAVTSTDLRVYPNPTAGNANVVFGSEVGGKYTINVINALGQVVYSKTASSTTGENTHAIDISELSSGLYFINLLEDSGMRSLRLVKK